MSEETQNNPAGNLRVLEVGQRASSQQAADDLEQLAAQARRGEVTGYYGIVMLSDHRYQTVGAGKISRAAVARLGYAVRDDA